MRTQKQDLSRRHFLRGMSTALVGAAVAGTAGFAGYSTLTARQAVAATNKTIPYKKLDTGKAQKRAYEHYFKGG